MPHSRSHTDLITEWISHKPLCAVMGVNHRIGWRSCDEGICNCGLEQFIQRLSQQDQELARLRTAETPR